MVEIIKKMWTKDEVLNRIVKLKLKKEALRELKLKQQDEDFETNKVDKELESWKKRYDKAME